MKFHQGLIIVFFSAALAAGAASYLAKTSTPSDTAGAKETRLEQVKRTGVLRCGYISWPPFLSKDPNSGQMGGVMYDLVEEMGRQLKLKIEWAGEAATGQMLSDLALNRFDMICVPFFQTPGRAREGDFTMPVFFMPVYLYVRQNDARFDKEVMAANTPEVRFATLDGEFSSIGAQEHFPEAAKVALPQLSSGADLFVTVLSNKADAVVDDYGTFVEFDINNPGKMRIAGNKPLSVPALGMPIPANEPAFKAMLNTTIAYLHDSGFVGKILDKYEATKKMPRVAKPYATSEKEAP